MKLTRPLPIHLRGLILLFVLISILATLGNSFLAAYWVQRDALIHSTLQANEAYASKLASSIGAFLSTAHNQLTYSARILAKEWGNPEVLREEAIRLQAQDNTFNSIVIADAQSKVLQAYPDTLRILPCEGLEHALQARRPLVSKAYTSAAGNLMVFISQPVFNASGTFLGVVGGSVYLRKPGAFQTVSSGYFQREGTFAFVADSNRRLLYHLDESRIGRVLDWSPTVDAALRGERGNMAAPNYKGIAMLAGYAQIPDANWAVVVQQPEALSLATLKELMYGMLLGMIPASIVGLALILIVTTLIARPLRQLSAAADQLVLPDTGDTLQKIDAWYRDASAIRQAMLTGVQLFQHKLGQLSHDAQSDALTGLANRRALSNVLELLTQTGQGYSVLALDIDHFKRVNDTFGHDAGDVALRKVAEVLNQNCRAGDRACRSGGEEFVMILPDTRLEVAWVIAERIREQVAKTPMPQAVTLTMSIGVACKSDETETPASVLKRADERLYSAKHNGRNRVM